MNTIARRFTTIVAILGFSITLLSLTGCGSGHYLDKDEVEKVSQELESRGFTNVHVTENVDSFPMQYAKFTVSYGSCPLEVVYNNGKLTSEHHGDGLSIDPDVLDMNPNLHCRDTTTDAKD